MTDLEPCSRCHTPFPPLSLLEGLCDACYAGEFLDGIAASHYHRRVKMLEKVLRQILECGTTCQACQETIRLILKQGGESVTKGNTGSRSKERTSP